MSRIDWDIADPDNEWGFRVPEHNCGVRKYNADLTSEQGLEDGDAPEYGILVQTRVVHRNGQQMTIFYYSSGWVETWYWSHCPPYRYKEGYWVEGVWYPPDWDRDITNDEWWDKQQPNYKEKDYDDDINWD